MDGGAGMGRGPESEDVGGHVDRTVVLVTGPVCESDAQGHSGTFRRITRHEAGNAVDAGQALDKCVGRSPRVWLGTGRSRAGGERGSRLSERNSDRVLRGRSRNAVIIDQQERNGQLEGWCVADESDDCAGCDGRRDSDPERGRPERSCRTEAGRSIAIPHGGESARSSAAASGLEYGHAWGPDQGNAG